MDKKFSLKDFLFNLQKVEGIAHDIKRVYSGFDENKFIKLTVDKFPELELKARISWISTKLKEFLPNDYKEATTILVSSLPPPNDHTKTDDDFGDFIYAPYADFVAKYGCSRQHLTFSLNALKEITMRFSAEDAIRYFLNAFPVETLKELKKWTSDSHYHVRRLTSEGTRPKLPWAQKISIPQESTIPILDNLYTDTTRFVTRSVANHLNDISKTNPDLVINTLKRWKDTNKQNPKEMQYIIEHSLRTLVKLGYKNAIEFLNFSANPKIEVTKVKIKNNPVVIGQYVEFMCIVTAKKDETLLIDYIIHFQNKNGQMNSKKVFKYKQIAMKKNQQYLIHKKHKLRKEMTTRKLYAGEHRIEIQINGKKIGSAMFDLEY